MKSLFAATALTLGLTFGLSTTPAFASAEAACKAKAAEKKLAGAAESSFVKKCVKDAGEAAPAVSTACEKSAADKKLAGAAKTAHIKKCMADEQAAAPKK